MKVLEDVREPSHEALPMKIKVGFHAIVEVEVGVKTGKDPGIGMNHQQNTTIEIGDIGVRFFDNILNK